VLGRGVAAFPGFAVVTLVVLQGALLHAASAHGRPDAKVAAAGGTGEKGLSR
jgi:hypothetical protein